jgi:hypothetical protein
MHFQLSVLKCGNRQSPLVVWIVRLVCGIKAMKNLIIDRCLCGAQVGERPVDKVRMTEGEKRRHWWHYAAAVHCCVQTDWSTYDALCPPLTSIDFADPQTVLHKG